MRNIALALLLLAFGLHASAQRSNFTKYLIPLATEDVPGAHGSLWRTEWVVHNGGGQVAQLLWNLCINALPGECSWQHIPPHTTIRPLIGSRMLSEGSQGAFLYIPKSADPFIGMTLRVRDLSQNAQSFGTELPIVSEHDYTVGEGSSLYLLDIPTEAKYRARLRIYGPDETKIPVQVAVFADGSDAPAEAYTVQLEGVAFITQPDFPLAPAYAELDPLTAAVRNSGDRVRVVVQSESPIWAFITVTNNETQQVTTVTSR